VAYRTVEVAWLPRSKVAWATFTAARTDAASLWNGMVAIHARIRRLRWQWPCESRWRSWAKGKFPALCAKSVQMIIRDFCDAVFAASQARKGQRSAGVAVKAMYPWKVLHRRDVPYCNQTAKIRDGFLRLTGNRSGHGMRVKLPSTMTLPGRVIEASLCYGVVRIVCEVADDIARAGIETIGVDVGVNTMACASDGVTALVINGRESKANVQYLNKKNASLRSKAHKHKKGSRRHKRAQRRLHKNYGRYVRKQRDLCHKVTRAIASAFGNAAVIVGRPYSSASGSKGPVVAQSPTGRITSQLAYKLSGARKVSEAYSSQTCPVCGCLQKCKRVYRCKACGLTAPRDVVGAVNIRAIGLYGKLTPEQPMPTVTRFVRPLRKYPRPPQGALGSSGGTPASSSEAA
jgi:putative transposase